MILIYKVVAFDWEVTLVKSEDTNKLIKKLHWLIWNLKQEINNNNI